MMAASWLWPTIRTLRLTPLLGVSAGTALAWGVACAATGRLPAELGTLGCGAIAAGVPLALEDPARSLLAPLPTGERTRLVRRVGIAGVVTMAGWSLTSTVSGLIADDTLRRPSTAALLALTAVGTAGMALLQQRHITAAATAGAAIPLGWTAARWFVPDSLGDLASAWSDRSLAVTAAALIIILVGAPR